MGGSLSYYGTSYSQGSTSAPTACHGVHAGLADGLHQLRMPDAALPNNRFCVFWDDLYPPTGGQIFYGNVNGDFVATWNGISRLSGTGTLTVQIVLDFDNTAVYFNYNTWMSI
jgi:hypothetical protein